MAGRNPRTGLPLGRFGSIRTNTNAWRTLAFILHDTEQGSYPSATALICTRSKGRHCVVQDCVTGCEALRLRSRVSHPALTYTAQLLLIKAAANIASEVSAITTRRTGVIQDLPDSLHDQPAGYAVPLAEATPGRRRSGNLRPNGAIEACAFRKYPALCRCRSKCSQEMVSWAGQSRSTLISG